MRKFLAFFVFNLFKSILKLTEANIYEKSSTFSVFKLTKFNAGNFDP